MNSREFSIITLVGQNDSVNVKDVAQINHVSVRTIRNDLKSINEILSDNHLAQLTIKPDGQIIKSNDFSQLSNYIIIKDFYTYKLSKKERVQLAGCILSSATDYTTFAQIADKLMVSRATIISDLKDIKSYMKRWDVELISYPNKGVRAKGEEINKRNLLLATEVNRIQLLKILDTNPLNEKIVQRILDEKEREYDQFLTDESYNQLCFYLCIMISRNHLQCYLDNIKGTQHVFDKLAESVITLIAQYCNIEVNESEIRYLSFLLCECRFIRKKAPNILLMKAQFLSRRLIELVSIDLKIDLTHDFDLYMGLSQHLATMYSNVKDYPTGEFFDEFKRENDWIIHIVSKYCYLLEEYYKRKISANELIYICFHFCAGIERKNGSSQCINVMVVCSSGIGTSQLLIAKLNNYFNFNILKAVSLHELEYIDTSDVDLIISTVEIKEPDQQYVLVNPLLKDKDFLKISSVLHNFNHKKTDISHHARMLSSANVLECILPIIEKECPGNYKQVMKRIEIKLNAGNGIYGKRQLLSNPGLHDLLSEDFIKLEVTCNTWEDAIRKAGIILLEKGYIHESYIDEIINNIYRNGPYIVFSKGFAFPHESFDKGSRQLGMSLIRLKKPVKFNSENDPVDFVCMLSTINRKSHLKAFFAFVNLLQNIEFKQKLYIAKTPAEVVNLIKLFEDIAI